jgi:hydroxymethylglutaryl-CoA lyase
LTAKRLRRRRSSADISKEWSYRPAAMERITSVQINEITPRDGLQNIENFIPTQDKAVLIDMLVKSGVRYLESTAFVSPKWVPQLSDALETFSHTRTHADVRNSVLVPNRKGFERARECGAGEIVFVLSASEIHNRSNVNKSVDESLEEAVSIAGSATESGIIPRANVATVFGYQPEEEISPAHILRIASTLEEAGFAGITLCDTTGIAAPDQVHELCGSLLERLDRVPLAIHLHQCGGIEFANAYAALTAGIRIFESAAGGLGGCPFAENTDGNIATEQLVAMFTRMGIDSGIDQTAIDAAAGYAKSLQAEYSSKPEQITNDTHGAAT